MWLKMNNPFHNKYELIVCEMISDDNLACFILHYVPYYPFKAPDHSHDRPMDGISICVLLPVQDL